MRGILLLVLAALAGACGDDSVPGPGDSGADRANDTSPPRDGDRDAPRMDSAADAADGTMVDHSAPDATSDTSADSTPTDTGMDASDDAAAETDAGDTSADADVPTPPDAAEDADAGDADVEMCSSPSTCVADAPSGWIGPAVVYQGAGAPPPCPTGTSLAFDAHAGVTAPDATCSTCTCGEIADVDCSAPEVRVYASMMCDVAPCATGTVGPTCTLIKTAGQCAGATLLYLGVSSTASGGSCEESTVTPTVVPATWSSQARACTPATTCPGGVCADPGGLALCIYRPGDLACPTGSAYASRSLVFQGLADDRGCSDCTCDPPEATCEGGNVVVTPNVSCGSGIANPVPSTCRFDGIPPTLPYYATVTTPPTATGMCTPRGGAPRGSATPTEPVTICCRP